MNAPAWYTDPSTRCPAVKTSPYRSPVQCTRDAHEGGHFCAYTGTTWAAEPFPAEVSLANAAWDALHLYRPRHLAVEADASTPLSPMPAPVAVAPEAPSWR